MLFHSVEFGFFMLAVLGLSAVLAGHRHARQLMLLTASYAFYMAWNARYLGLIVFSTVLDYVIGAAIARTSDVARRKLLLAVSIAGNLGVLGIFKYYGFFAENLYALLSSLGLHPSFPTLQLLLPVGISFYTFQSMSYTIDIYRGTLEPRKSLVEFALFVGFFPQLVAGPIVRASQFLPQLDSWKGATPDETSSGIYLILKGLTKKVLIADMLGRYLVDPVFGQPGQYGAVVILIALYGFKFQIYNDFSGYSDIAIGIGRLLGYQLPINFRSPYKAHSISNYWQRWHMTLGSWFRDYLFFPLGGTREGLPRICMNLLITMGLIGLWHGASWNFVLWGAYYGVLMSIERIIRWALQRAGIGSRDFADASNLRKLLQIGFVFQLTTLAVLPFRSPDMITVQELVSTSCGRLFGVGVNTEVLLLLAVAAVLHFAPESLKAEAEERFVQLPALVQGAICALGIGLIVTTIDTANPYYYFQF